ncbi:MAG: DUF302 domain-containing protein [Gammaproteobacteria bacterium]|nr:MAG: DUF302 domain-containing protein [Gammaproteobacteria bacterium]
MYHFHIDIDGEIDQVVDKTLGALKEEGFGVLMDLDIQATLKAKLDVDRLPYRILGACNPPLANQALDAEPDIGVLLPCNVVVRGLEDGKVRVTFMDPDSVLALVDNDQVGTLAEEVKERLQRVRDRLAGG